MSVSPELAAADAEGRLQVARPSSGMPTWVIALLAVAVGLAVLLTLTARRDGGRATAAVRRFATPMAPPLPPSLRAAPGALLDPPPAVGPGPIASNVPFAAPLVTSPFAVRAMPTARAYAPPPPPGREANPELGGRTYSFRTEPMPGAPGPGSAAGGMAHPVASGTTVIFDVSGASPADDRAALADGGTVRARLLRNRPSIVAQGEVIAATLETPLSSSRPGPIRAVVARDVRGFDGSRVLIPRGSRLIGEYRADPAPGRRRILATWTRLIRPDGVAIRIDSPASDPLGGTGIPGKVDTHFLARFANAALQSALQIGVNLASRPRDGGVIVTNTPQMSAVMGQGLIPGADDPPTVTARAGAAVAVFVARDLDFSGVPEAR